MIFQVRSNSKGSLRPVRSAGGFTLLEVVIVLGMIAILVTWLTLTTGTVETEEQLRRATGEISGLTKRARSIAVQQQRPYKVTISKDSIAIAPLNNQSGNEVFEDADGNRIPGFKDVIDSEETESGVTYEVLRWGSDVWLTIEDDKEVVLRLEPTGLVEPISIRCTVGKSWLIQEFHPLTAGVRDEEMSIEKE